MADLLRYFDGLGMACYTHTDYQGSVIVATDSVGRVVHHVAYYPYGEPWSEPGGQPMLFGGKERESRSKNSLYGPRQYSAAAMRWWAPDLKAGDYTPQSPYTFCASNPVLYFEVNGKWYVKVSASADRGNHPYAIYSVYSRNDEPVFRTVAKVRGNNRGRNIEKGDSPVGYYKIRDWAKTGIILPGENNIHYPMESYGKSYVLRLDYESDQEGGSRNGMHTHAGRSQSPDLTDTWGCFRLSEEDMVTLKNITDDLEAHDPEEKREKLLLLDDLEEPITFQDREEIMNSCNILLPEVIIEFNQNIRQ